MEITYAEIKLVNAILGTLGHAVKPWFSHDRSQNMSTLEPYIKAITEAEKPSKEFLEYQAKCQPFILEHSIKDDDGNPVVNRTASPGGAVRVSYPLEDPKAYKEAVADLEEEYFEAISAEEVRAVDLPDFYKHTVELELLQLKYSEAPPESLTSEAMHILMKCGILIWDLKRESAEEPSEDPSDA